MEQLTVMIADAVRSEVGAGAVDADEIDADAAWVPAPESRQIFQDWADGLPPAQRVMARVVELAGQLP